MTDVLFRFDIEAPPDTVLKALKTTEGIKGFWTTRAEVPSEVGETLKLKFASAPLPFDLRLEESGDGTVVWRTQTFPPHWTGTTIRWTVTPNEQGSRVTFRHEGFASDDDDDVGMIAYTWGQIMVALKKYSETGRADPVFV
jgi:uncharacterized protein YndB with AHSA1/START domain